MSNLEKKSRNAIRIGNFVWLLLLVLVNFFLISTLNINLVAAIAVSIVFSWLTRKLPYVIGAIIITATITQEDIKEMNDAHRKDTEEDLSRRLANGEDLDISKELAAKGLIQHVTVRETGPVVGHYKEMPIYEFITMSFENEKLEKFFYHGPTNIVNGIPQIPVMDDKMFANVQGILYYKDVQPAN